MTQHLLLPLRNCAARFCAGQQGSVSVETVIIFPVIAWALMAGVTFVDVFRHQTGLQKSVYTTADLVSRASGNALDPAFFEGLFTFKERINDTHLPLAMRVSLVGWDIEEEEFRVVWSYGALAASLGPLDDLTLNSSFGAQIPPISPGETLILTEGWLAYDPPFRVGLQPRVLGEMALTRPRFAPGVVFDDPNAPPPPMAWCDYVIDACGM